MTKAKTKTKCSVTSGTCHSCVQACHRNPGWMNPVEAVKAIAAGFAPKLMLDWLDPDLSFGNKETIWILCPAARHFGGSTAPDMGEMIGGGSRLSFISTNRPYKGRCVLLGDDDRCTIHTSGFKPQQCRETVICAEEGPDNYDMARLWDTDEGRAVVVEWKRVVHFRKREKIDDLD